MSFKRCYTCIGFFCFLLYSPCKVEVSLGFLIRCVYHGEDFSFFSCFCFFDRFLILLMFLFTLIKKSFVSDKKKRKKKERDRTVKSLSG